MNLPNLPLPRTALAAAALALVAGCGGGGGDPAPNPNPNAALDATQITTAQAAVEPAASAVDAGAAVLSASQINTQQRTAVDRATIAETASLDATSIAANQSALDTGENLTPAF